MLRQIHIRNFKSVADLKLDLGRFNVFIGENGCGKSNILEAIAFAAAASIAKLENEFLASRGIRITEPRFMRSAFDMEMSAPIELGATADSDVGMSFTINEEIAEGQSYPTWKARPKLSNTLRQTIKKTARGSAPLSLQFFKPTDASQIYEEFLKTAEGTQIFEKFEQILKKTLSEKQRRKVFSSVINTLDIGLQMAERFPLFNFLIYAPENTSLRTFEREGQILPLGIKGEGLFKLLRILSSAEDKSRWNELKKNLRLLDWFEDLEIAPDLAPFEQALRIKDRFLDGDLARFDQRSSNEGFLFLLFYFALFVSSDTPEFFAIDNIDASLNPKTSRELTRRLAELAPKFGKQVIVTTHNPAVLDGLNLHDDEQRLFVIHRNSKGYTRARRVTAPQPVAGETPIKLSEAFLRGLLGGLPQNF